LLASTRARKLLHGIVAPMRAMAAGLALYALLVVGLDAAESAAIPLNALKAVLPGFAVGWLGRSRGLKQGALVGALGGLVEVGRLAFADLPLGIPDPLVLASVYTVAGAALTNALGGAAGESLSSAGEARTRR
jgi:hypothetical protein